jgi:hypothetical protein
MKTGSGRGLHDMYIATKFTQFLGAQWWRRQLLETNKVIAVSPGMIPSTGLGRHWEKLPDMPAHVMKDAKSIPEGMRSGVFPTNSPRI